MTVHEEQSRSSAAGRRVKHVSRSCKECRRRKTKCNGDPLGCNGCRDRGVPCDYTGLADKRHTRVVMKDLQDDIKRQAVIIESLRKELDRLRGTNEYSDEEFDSRDNRQYERSSGSRSQSCDDVAMIDALERDVKVEC
ncbi:hypothetical protein EXIGLDRAFT_735985 [Exidia glandulosa HHB12029]|uniref:Zn(2)-C6 fungal-type domain-containing protein n=1 Tax=Exidia glandulosa HHB12029 TaxID=1314781 RepID=A0A165JMY6_EXIGL|nr:hypothetical protein EXIGLDRAFT_728425 [Exidia glandulosa HHB12029]KZV95083.1 hypothetical protein EXIGLDRAFT_735985 [Exidia glandulosa HHB12029]